MQYINQSILCLTGSELIKTDKNPDGIMPEGTYKSLQQRSKKRSEGLVVHGCGGNGRTVLIEYNSLPDLYKNLVKEKLCGGIDPHEYMAKQPIRDLIKTDYKAIEYFEHKQLNGRPIKENRRVEYANNAAILNAFKTLLADKKKLKATLNISLQQFWQTACETINDLKYIFPNNLPTSERRLKPIYKAYIKDGYEALIDGRAGNENNRKVDDDLEKLILSLYIQNNKPYSKEVHEIYERFMAGELEAVDVHSGEIFERERFIVDGNPITISDTTVWKYINKPINRVLVDKFRTSGLEHSSKHKPHIHRLAPQYSFSKITMDDISIPFKMEDGARVWSYQIFDVASQCVIGVAFGKDKNRELFTEAVMNMFRLIINNGWGTPAEIEVEQHISNTFADDLLKEGYLFPFVRFCRGGNPQEKRAEGFIRGKKYQHQSKREGFQRRPFAKLEANRMNEDKNKVRYSFDEIVANEQQDISYWNNSLHPDQVKYKGKTRWQVLCEHQNPQLVKPNIPLLSKYIGCKTTTSIQRSQKVRVKNELYELPSPKVLALLNDLTVTAYYIHSNDESINEVHLYQDGNYICTCQKLERFNEAIIEQTEHDIHIMHKQLGYVSAFDAMINEKAAGLTKKVAIHSNDNTPAISQDYTTPYHEPQAETIPYEDETDYNDEDYWNNKALKDI